MSIATWMPTSASRSSPHRSPLLNRHRLYHHFVRSHRDVLSISSLTQRRRIAAMALCHPTRPTLTTPNRSPALLQMRHDFLIDGQSPAGRPLSHKALPRFRSVHSPVATSKKASRCRLCLDRLMWSRRAPRVFNFTATHQFPQTTTFESIKDVRKPLCHSLPSSTLATTPPLPSYVLHDLEDHQPSGTDRCGSSVCHT